MSEPSPALTNVPTHVLLVPAPNPNDPPPPYPSHRQRGARAGRRRRTLADTLDRLQIPTGNADNSDPEALTPSSSSPLPLPLHPDVNLDATETTPLLTTSPRLPPGGIGRRQRTLSLTSTVHSTHSIAPSFAQTVLSAFQPERDCDLDPDDAPQSDDSGYEHDHTDSPGPRVVSERDSRLFAAELASPGIGAGRRTQPVGRWRRYFRPLAIKAYYSALFHLLVLNFPYALAAWVYLFVFTLTGTTTLMALPLGAVLCFLDLIGARTFARGEVALQTTFHGPLAFSRPSPPLPIFTRMRAPSTSELEAGPGPRKEASFYRNAYAMFTDSTSYQALFYFLIIKPGITILLSLFLITVTPVAFVLILPAPAMLRLVRRLGIWQANIAVEGLCYAVR